MRTNILIQIQNVKKNLLNISDNNLNIDIFIVIWLLSNIILHLDSFLNTIVIKNYIIFKS